MIKRIISILVSISVILGLTGCSKATTDQKRYESQFILLFDTISTIVGYSDSKDNFTEISQKIYDELLTYHELYDIYNDYDGINNIKTINDNAGKEPVKVDKKIIDLLKFSLEQDEKIQEGFNIGYGSVLKLWHKYREDGIDDPDNAKLPPQSKLEEAAKHTDLNNIVIDEEKSTVFIKDPEMKLDVGSVAKGYAVEQVAVFAEKEGLKNGLISVGGNVRAIGKHANGKEWSVGIQNPNLESDKDTFCTVKIDNMSVVSSGDYQRYYTVNDKKYHHIINPKTLYPSEYFSSVTVITKDSGLADVLSTALFNIPYEQGLELVNSLDNTEAVWVLKDYTVKYSDNFKDYMK